MMFSSVKTRLGFCAALIAGFITVVGLASPAQAIPDGDSPTLSVDCSNPPAEDAVITNAEVGDILWIQVTNGNDASCKLTLPGGMFSVTQAGGTLGGGLLGLQNDSRLQIFLSGDFTITYPNSTTRSFRVDACSLVGYGTVASPWLIESEADSSLEGVTEGLASPPAATVGDDLNSNGFLDSCPESGQYLRTWSPEEDGEPGQEVARVIDESLPATGLESAGSTILLISSAALTLGGFLLLARGRRHRLRSRN